MNNQEAFDKMVVHLFTQKEPARQLHNDTCVYRMDDGKKCAVGALIPDGEYKASFEGLSIADVYAQIPTLQDVSESLLGRVQHVHDSIRPTYWHNRLSSLAEDFKLSTTVLETYKEVKL